MHSPRYHLHADFLLSGWVTCCNVRLGMTSEMVWKVVLCPDMIKHWPSQDIPFPWGGLSTGRGGFGKGGFTHVSSGCFDKLPLSGFKQSKSILSQFYRPCSSEIKVSAGRLPSKASREGSLLLPPASGSCPGITGLWLHHSNLLPSLWNLLLN